MDQLVTGYRTRTAINQVLILAGFFLTLSVAHAQMSIGVYAGQPGLFPNSSASTTNTCANFIPLYGSVNSSTPALGANTGDGCPINQILLHSPTSTWIDAYGQLYIADRAASASGSAPAETNLSSPLTNATCTANSASTYTTLYTSPSKNSTLTCAGFQEPGPGFSGEARVLYNGTNSALATALYTNWGFTSYEFPSGTVLNSTTSSPSLISTGNVYNVGGGGTTSGYTQAGGYPYRDARAIGYIAVDAAGNIYNTIESEDIFVNFVAAGSTNIVPFLDACSTTATSGSGSSVVQVASAVGSTISAVCNSGSSGANPVVGAGYDLLAHTGSGYGGDGGYVHSSEFSGPRGMAFDAAGDLYVADYGDNVVREVNIAGATTDLLGNSTQLGYVTTVVGGAGAGCAEAASGSTGGTACTSTFAGDGGPARAAQMGNPSDLIFDSYGNLYVTDKTNARIRVVYAGTQPPAGFYPASGHACAGNTSTATTGTAATCGDVYTFAGGGTSVAGGVAATSIELSSPLGLGIDSSNNLYIADNSTNKIWEVVSSSDIATIIAGGGTTTTEATCSTDGYGDGCSATNVVLSQPQGHISVDSNGYLYFADYGNNVVRVLKPYTQGATTQTISFTQPATPVTYGASAISLGATASSSLAVSYSVTGPATVSSSGVLSFTGSGTVVVTASQAGNTTYAAATPVSRTIVVNQAPLALNVTAGTYQRYFGQENSQASPAIAYTLTGFVSLDTQASATSGLPAFTGADPQSPVGSYTISAAIGTLTATNYSFNPGSSTATLNIVANTGSGAAQAILFAPLANFTHTISVPLLAIASSGLPVIFTVTSGTSYASISGSTLTVSASGSVTVTASQPGSSSFAPATNVAQTFTAQ